MFRHYLPSIAAAFALLLAIIIVPIGGELVPEKITNLRNNALAQIPRCVEPPSGITNWWDADNVSGTIAKDLVGAVDGSMSDVSLVPGKVKNAFSFKGNDFNQFGRIDGTGSFVRFPQNFFPYPTTQVGDNPFSFDLWFKTTTDGVIFGQQTSKPWEGIWSWIPAIFVGTDGDLGVEMFADGRPPIYSNRSVKDGVWHHLGVTYDGTTQIVYLDGANIGNTQKEQHPYSGIYHYQLGTGATWGRKGGEGGWHSFKGEIDEFTIYNRHLSAEEVRAIFNAGDHGKCKLECGNNFIQGGEVCDGTDLAGKTCEMLMGPGFKGPLSCASNCQGYNTTQCSAPALCSDGKDNDNDKLIDYPSDPGCTSPDDGDETDPPPPPIEKIISLKKSAKPTITIMPLLAEREVLKFQTTCATCTIQTSQDPLSFIGGSAAANNGFVIIASLLDTSSNTYSHTIIAVGEFEQQTKLFNNAGQEYVGIGEDLSNQYPIGILANAENEIYVRTRINNQFEQIKMSALLLPASANSSASNGSVHYHLFIGEDANGKGYMVVAKARRWDAATLADPSLTPEPFYSFFLGKGTLAQCVQSFQNYPQKESLVGNINNFQLFLELFSLCQR
jgi:hypothetical protein